MNAAFDTLAAAQDLEAAGIERRHAEAIARVVHHGDERVATKADLEQLRTATKADLEQLRTATKADLEQLRAATKADLEQLRTATKADLEQLRIATKADLAAEIAKLETRMVWKLLGVAALVVAAIKLIPAAS